MTRLAWGAVGEHFFETGVDRGVLYVDNNPGVPWNGLVSVAESPTGGDISEYYIDGIKYLVKAAGENFEATLEAYTYPDEFGPCEGRVAVSNGLSMTHQKKKSFGLCYRTRVGNDVDGTEHGYKIHLVYGITASPTQRTNTSINDQPSVDNFSWKLTTKPPTFVGYKPTAHMIIDSRDAPSDLLTMIENILYGSDDADARLLAVPELLFWFASYSNSVFDAGSPIDPYYITLDGGDASGALQTATVDGGTS